MINLKRFLFEDKLEATQMNAQILFCSFAVMGLLLFIILVYLIKKYISTSQTLTILMSKYLNTPSSLLGDTQPCTS